MPPMKRGVRPPTLAEGMRARQAAMRARVEALKNRFLEPILARFPRLLPTRPDSAAKYAMVASIVWFAVGLLLSMLLAVKLVFPEFLIVFPWLGYGRLAGAATAVLIWGALFTGFAAAMFAIVPRLTGTKLWSERIGAQTVLLHSQVVLAGVVLLLLGRTQGINGLEFIWPIDLLLLNVMLMVAQNVVATVARRRERRLAPPIWYFLAAVIVLPITYGIGNLGAPFYFGVDQQIVAGFARAGTLAGISMMGLGTAYYVLARATGKPIYSERLTLIGFWSFVFAAPWIGQIWAVLGPGPDYLETVAITFALWLIIPALCVLVNFWGTLRDSWDEVHSDPALKFIVAGTLVFVWGTVQMGIGSLRTMQNVVGHTAWDFAVHDAITGGLGLFLIAAVYHQFPRMIGRVLYSARWATRQVWVQSIGLATAVIASSVAGVLQGYTIISGVQMAEPTGAGRRWFVTSLATKPMFILRIGGGALVALGLFIFVTNIMRTYTLADDAEVEKLPFETAEPERVGVPA